MRPKIITTLVCTFLVILQVVANPITPEQALARLKKDSQLHHIKPIVPQQAEPKLKMTMKASNGLASLYVFEQPSNNGFMVLSADDKAPAMLGFSDSGTFDSNNLPPNLQYWLEEYSRQIAYISENQIESVQLSSNPEWHAIPPLVQTKWNQSYPYNSQCPIIDGRRCVTGCVATAMAQIMNYHKWPQRGQGSNSYTYNGNTYSMDFSQIEFDWDNMLDEYDENSSQINCDAVATLMKACGHAVNMMYGTWESGAYTSDVVSRMPCFFDYSDDVYHTTRNNYTSERWSELLYDQLSKGLPIFYDGRDGIWINSSGHAFICDGYDGEGYFHFNWGWGGSYDGYFLLSALVPSGAGIGGSISGYNFNQSCIVNLYPANNPQDPIVEYRGQNLSVDSQTGIITTWVYSQHTSLSPLAMNFGLEITAEQGGLTVILPWGEFARTANNSSWDVSHQLTRGELRELGLGDGKYTGRIVYLEKNTWKRVLFYAASSSVIDITVDGTSMKLAIKELQSPVVISDAKFNDGHTIVKDRKNYLTYRATNNSDQPIYWASQHYLIPVDSPSKSTSLYNVNLVLNVGESRIINIPIESSKLSSLNTGDYYLSVQAGLDFSNQYIYSDKSIVFRLTDTSEAISDDVFQYVVDADKTLTIIGLNNSNSRLSGDAIIPDQTNINGKTYQITGIFSDFSELIDIENIVNLEIKTPITSLPNSALRNAKKLVSITLPSSLTSIGGSAFESCSSLTSIDLSECISLTSIGDYAFAYCTSLSSVTIGNSVTSIEVCAFRSCPSLTTITCLSIIPPSIEENTFGISNYGKSTLFVPEESAKIYASADGWKNFVYIVTDDTVLTDDSFIYRKLYDGTLVLLGLKNPSSKLSGDVIIPEQTSIDGRTYQIMGMSCELYELIYIENVVNLEIKTPITNLPSFYNVKKLVSIALPSSLTSIGGWAFESCSSLTSIDFSKCTSLTSIGECAFRYCNSLTSIDLSKCTSLTSIKHNAFYSCNKLSSVIIGNSVTSIGVNAFRSCPSLTTIQCLNTIPPIVESTFDTDTYEEAILIVPEEAVTKYASADGWKNFTSVYPIGKVPVSSISLNRYKLILKAMESIQLKSTVLPDIASNKTVTWTTSDEGVAIVSEDGVVTAISIGTAQIKATATDGSGVEAECTVTVIPTPVESITLDKNAVSLHVNDTIVLNATVMPENATDKRITWVSTNPEIAIVGADGTVTARAIGETTVKAISVSTPEIDKDGHVELISSVDQLSSPYTETTEGSLAALLDGNASTFWHSTWTDGSVEPGVHYLQVELIEPVNQDIYMSLTRRAVINNHITECGVYGTNDFDADKSECMLLATISMPYGSNTETIVSEPFSTQGFKYLRFYANATTTGNGYWHVSEFRLAYDVVNNHLHECHVTVVPTPATDIEITQPTSTEFEVGQSMKLNAVILPEDATDKTVTWSSSDETIAVVSEEGMVTAVHVGQVEITAENSAGNTASIKLSVIPTLAESITIKTDTNMLQVGQTTTLSVTVLPENTTTKAVKWTTSDKGVAIVSEDGVVTAISIGTAQIKATVTDGSGVEAECTVTVIPTPVESITLDKNAVSLHVNDTVVLNATVMPETATDKRITWVSTNPEIATVGADGTVTARAIGETTVKAISVSTPEIIALCSVSVVAIPVQELKLNTKEMVIDVNDGHFTLSVTILPENAATPTLLWTSSNETVATVVKKGELEAEVTPISSGTTIITVTLANDFSISDSCEIEITNASDITMIFTEGMTITIYDLHGRIVKHCTTPEDLRGIIPGIYIIKRGSIFKKILIK